MAALDTVSLTIMFGALLVLAGILSSLVALRFGAPLLLVFLLVGMLAGEAGPGGIKFDDVNLTYTVGSVALALILFDGGLRTRFATFRSVVGPVADARHHRRAAHRRADGAGRALPARLRLGAVAARRRRHLLDRRCGGVPAHPFPRAAAASARRRDARDRVRDQRSVRDLPHHGAGAVSSSMAANPGIPSSTSSRSKGSAAPSSA